MQRLILTFTFVFTQYLLSWAQSAPVVESLSISGTPNVGEELTAVFNITDVDGGEALSSTIQWYSTSDGVTFDPISGETNASYTVRIEDKDKTLKVEVTPISSAEPATGTPVSATILIKNTPPVAVFNAINGIPHVGETIHADYSITDLEGDPYDAEFQWFRLVPPSVSYEPIVGETSSTYQIKIEDKDLFLRVEVTPTASSGASPGVMVSGTIEVLNTAPKAVLKDFIGTPIVGNIVAADYEINDLEEDSYSPTFKWFRSDAELGTYEPIDGAIDSEYKVQVADIGKYLKVELTPVASSGVTPGDMVFKSIKVANTAPILIVNSIDGIPNIGQNITVNYTVNDPVGGAYTVDFKWYRCDTEFGTYSPILSAASATYTIQSADKDQFLKVELTPKTSGGPIPDAMVFKTIKIANNPPVAIINSIDGTPNVGQILTANYSISDPEGDEYTANFQWSSSATELGTYTPIASATHDSYTVQNTDKDQYLKVELTPTATSGATPGATVFKIIKVANTPPSVNISGISGTPAIGQQLTVNYSLSDLENDPTSAAFQWSRASTLSGTYTDIDGAVSQTYTIVLADKDKYLRVQVTPLASAGSSPGTSATSAIQVLNTPPVASNVNISGTVRYNSTITGNYTYSDLDQDNQGTSVYKWFISSSKNGSYTQITGAAQVSYTIKLADVGKYAFFEVTPVALTGELQGAAKHSDTVYIQNQPPMASNVYIQGTLEYGNIIRGKYTYSDLESNTQGTSLFKWYRSESETGVDKAQIAGATSETYVIQLEDIGKYISFEVTPVASSGTITGEPVLSSFSGPVLNSAPKASNLQIIGTQAVCKVLVGQYTYSDNEGDVEGYTTFRWLRASAYNGTKTPITGATNSSYTLTTDDQGKYIFFEVTPRAASGEINGVPTVSNSTGAILNLLPTVTFSGGASICAGKSANLTLVFSGNPPFILNYTNGAQKYSLNTSSYIYNLPVSVAGTYKADSLKDNLGCTVTNLTSQTTVTVNSLPDVHITGLNEAYSVYSPAVSLTATPVGGAFSGPGVVPSTKTFYPNIAGVTTTTPHAIVYSFTNSSTGCSNSDTVRVSVLDVNALISGIRPELKYCIFDKPFVITGVNSKGVNGTFSISGGVGLVDHGNNTATITPSALSGGQYTISYTYLDNVVQTLTKVITIEQFAKASILNVPVLNYCKNAASIKLTGNYASGVFSGLGISLKQTDYYFNPIQGKVGKDKVYYNYTTSYGCKSTDSLTFTVYSLPRVQFEVANHCWNGDSTVFINLSAPVDSITSWAWNLGDNAVTETKNKSAKFEPKHLYASAGNKTISLIAQNLLGCKDTTIRVIHLSDVPKIDFTWDKECFTGAANVAFTNKSVFVDEITSNVWTIQDDNSGTPLLLNTRNISLTFPQKKEYTVKLVMANVSGCKDSITKQLALRSIHFVKDSVYSNDFESASKWPAFSGAGANWVWGAPSGSIISNAHSGTKAVFTHIPVSRTNKIVQVSSPCFDFSGVQKPFIEMWVNANTESRKEGAQLQYTWDDSLVWRTVGDVGTGVNWYNDNAIVALPSASQIGWSGNTNGWVQVRHNLDNLKDQKNIKFRIIYGVNASSTPKDGFAFDDVLIGQRAKSVLFEHFTNQSSAVAIAANTELARIIDLAGTDAYSIQYHTSFPGADTLNMQNPQDPASRVLYYGVGSVPTCILDGGPEPKYVYDFVNRKPNIADINLRALKEADFDLEISSEYNMPTISGNVKVKALKDIASRNVSLYVAIVEDVNVQNGASTATYYNVLKKFLPSAAGTLLKSSWTIGEVFTVDLSWLSQYIYNPDKVKIIAYVQDEQTREVYQVKMLKVTPLVSIHPIITSEDKLTAGFYPNPVVSTATVVFNKALTTELTARIVDKNGRILNITTLQKGIGEYVADFSAYPNGLYFIQLVGRSAKTEVLKVMVMH